MTSNIQWLCIYLDLNPGGACNVIKHYHLCEERDIDRAVVSTLGHAESDRSMRY